jgi:hypothetical protein
MLLKEPRFWFWSLGPKFALNVILYQRQFGRMVVGEWGLTAR